MNKKKRILLAATLLLAAVIALAFLFSRNVVVGGCLYPKASTTLDLRGQEISASHYEKLTAKLPGTEIRWDIPFQGGILADDTTEITVTALTVEEAALLAKHLPKLRTVNAESCTDYDSLLALKQQRPGVQVRYFVPICGQNYASSSIQLSLSDITEADLLQLQYLPVLKIVTVADVDPEMAAKLQEYCTDRGILFRLQLGSEAISQNDTTAQVTGITNDALNLIPLMPQLKQLHLVEPLADAENIFKLQTTLPDVDITWEKTILGLTFRQNAVEIDLTDAISLGEGERLGDVTAYHLGLEAPVMGTPEETPSAVRIPKDLSPADKEAITQTLIEELEAAMAYFPHAEKLVMCGAVLNNAAMSAFREARKDDYKVVWSVQCGEMLVRTDAKFYMPVKHYIYYLKDEAVYNLRYCPEMVAVDVGHMRIQDISFVEYMPDLEYLILAHTKISHIEPLRTCKKLKFLELDWAGISDFSPLQGCTSLEDLNIGHTWADVEPLKQMTWLKNLWMIFRDASAYEMTVALPDTRIVCSGTATVDSGWRDLPNYFAMRDVLNMFYMSW